MGFGISLPLASMSNAILSESARFGHHEVSHSFSLLLRPFYEFGIQSTTPLFGLSSGTFEFMSPFNASFSAVSFAGATEKGFLISLDLSLETFLCLFGTSCQDFPCFLLSKHGIFWQVIDFLSELWILINNFEEMLGQLLFAWVVFVMDILLSKIIIIRRNNWFDLSEVLFTTAGLFSEIL